MHLANTFTYCSLLFIAALIYSCGTKKDEPALFRVLHHERTGLNFVNRLNPTPQFNMFKYMYFYNGAGVGAGDLNNDGKIDLFFASNQGENKLFLNKGNLLFSDVSRQANIPQDNGWSTGVSIVDINNDGLLDIYICRVGNFESLKAKNQFLVCEGISANGVPSYIDRASELGLDFSGFSTQAAFFDYDMDGDLDAYLLNHSVHQNGTFAARQTFLNTFHPLTGDRLFRNEDGHFADATKEAGINSSAIGYGLGICVSDINLDGYPDVYVGNDFHENDYLYINQRNGTFKEELTERVMHTSQFSMGVDVADINNDAFPEIISVDMLPSDPYILRRSLGEDEYNTFYEKIRFGYHYQYTRNVLQLNRRNGLFSDIGLYAGVAATDWSWAPLWMDFDNDGLKDLFISNGIPKRLNDIDYVNYVSNDEMQTRINANTVSEKEMSVIDNFPQIKLPNKFFLNKGAAKFEECTVADDISSFSNGAVYADLDNDGDLDVVVNNIDDPALVYENTTNSGSNNYLKLQLTGPAQNKRAIGARAVVFTKTGIRTYEKYPVKGFQSSMEVPLLIGMNNANADSILLIWPDNTYQRIEWSAGTTNMLIAHSETLPSFDYNLLTQYKPHTTRSFTDVTVSSNLLFRHEENRFNEFDREPLIPKMISREGPAVAVDDIDHDGLEDIFFGSSKGGKSTLFLQQKNGTFKISEQQALAHDSTYEDVDACWADVNNDGHVDLVVASGGNEYYGSEKYLLPRVYLNDGKANLTRLQDAFNNIFLTASCVAPYDVNGDGAVDLFIGGRAVPWEYGEAPSSYLLLNDGKGHFKNATGQFSKELSKAGFVTNAQWFDLNKDGTKDLVLTTEWNGIDAYLNKNGRLLKHTLTAKKGWWNFALPVDIDNDGDVDFIAGNLGWNSRLQASEKEPVKLFFNDFDGNGKKEQLLSYYINGREISFANKMELEKQIPLLKKKFLYAEDFAKSSFHDFFPREKYTSSTVLTANYFANTVLLNDGKMNFETKPLPWQAQLSTYRDAAIVNANDDNLPDVLLIGNFYDNNIQMGRYDADFGTMLINKGNGNFTCENLNGINVKGQIRRIKKIKLKTGEAMVLARNNDSALLIKMDPKQRR